ncbi:MAG TPA: TIGR02186 family protein, partial [Verrucomicrobiae bacterium]|nr:TIGR02186 family protein [Verrucomicrobiae bacterium]
MGRRLRLLPVFLLALLAAPPGARAEPLVADLSNHLIAITTGFTGANVLLFGATDGPGDIVAVVRGPTGRAIVRRKGRLFGIWVNKDATDFEEVPNFYAVASSRPLDQLLTPEMAQHYRVGLDNLGIRPAEEGAAADAPMLAALIGIKKTEQLYRPASGKVVFLGGQLFRADFHFPANVPTGTYLIEVMLVRNGKVESAQTTPLVVSKIGIGADIFEFAQRHSAAYGVVAILSALMA